ncbi:dihydroorotate dehydrogenase electron transfer subunit [soil metagenome]
MIEPSPGAHPLEASAPAWAARRTVAVIENRRIARDTFLLRLDDPEMARAIRPGQFLMIRPGTGGMTDPLLGRPFALYDVVVGASGTPEAIDVVYLIMGRGTQILAEKRPGDRLVIWGPLGNGFGPPPADRGSVAFVAGGIGQTPFLALGRWWLGQRSYGGETKSGLPVAVASATLFYGVRSADLAAGVEDFQKAGIAVEVATDDGSAGRPGFVTDLFLDRLRSGDRPSKVVGCGPPLMLAALSRIVASEGMACDLSLENHMACGFGACFSCVSPILQDDGSTDLRRVCIEGPIFPAERVVWPG